MSQLLCKKWLILPGHLGCIQQQLDLSAASDTPLLLLSDIKKFARDNYGASFPLMSKVSAQVKDTTCTVPPCSGVL